MFTLSGRNLFIFSASHLTNIRYLFRRNLDESKMRSRSNCLEVDNLEYYCWVSQEN